MKRPDRTCTGALIAVGALVAGLVIAPQLQGGENSGVPQPPGGGPSESRTPTSVPLLRLHIGR